jgi:hypothetical protein
MDADNEKSPTGWGVSLLAVTSHGATPTKWRRLSKTEDEDEKEDEGGN